jgi:hypothetical protein
MATRGSAAFLVLFGLLAVSALPAAKADIVLLNDKFGSQLQAYQDGVLVQTYTGTGANWSGAAVTPDGNYVTRYEDGAPVSPGVNIFNPAGAQIASFGTPNAGISSGISVFPDGTLALGDSSGDTMSFYTQAGTLVRSFHVPGVFGLFGSTVGADGLLYITGGVSHNIGRVQEDGTSLPPIPVSFSPGAVVMNPIDRTLFVSDLNTGTVVHLTTATTSGAVLGSFNIGLQGVFAGLAMASDDQSLYVTTTDRTVIRQFSLTGALLGEFPIVNAVQPEFLAVVPVPEPSALRLLGLGVSLLIGYAWSRRISLRRSQSSQRHF